MNFQPTRLLSASLGLLVVVACSAGGDDSGLTGPGGGAAGSGGGTSGSGAESGSGGTFIGPTGGSGGGGGGGFVNDPSTCEEAASNNSYIGCDYWPTVTANNVWSIFDFAVVVSNTGKEPADVHITGNGVDQHHQVQPGTLATIYLPWVPALKGADANECGEAVPINQSVLAAGGAFHLVSSRPVTVYQFNALQYKGEGGPPGKNWSSCPGNKMCAAYMTSVGCFSFSNDASLLLPSTAMTGNYRLAGSSAWTPQGLAMPTYAAVTATKPDTIVEVRAAGRIVAGGGMPAMNPGDVASVTLQQGDVLQIVGGASPGDDLSGSLIFANNPIQVITGMPCRNMPSDKGACDHIEESVFPAETLGKEYLVTVPAGPHGKGAPSVGHAVRIVGNVDNTNLHFDPPISAPGVTNGHAVIQAGQVLDLGQVAQDFKVWSEDAEFIVATFMLGASLIDPAPAFQPDYESKGDPSQSFTTAVEQFRSLYVFLAPQDYDVNFVNIVGPSDAQVNLDGIDIPPEWYIPIGGSGLGVVRFQLQPTGTHRLESVKPVGIQVYGYGSYTTYQYPGGLNLQAIAPPPPK